MSCSPYDLKDYFLQELADPQRLEVEAHVQTCPSCRLELDRLRLTHTALASLADEEIPRRIGFVSDKVFEPSPWRRGWAAFWASSARLGFASAAMLSVALIVSALARPAPAPRLAPAAAAVSDAEIRARIDAAIEREAAVIEARYAQRTEQLVKDIELRDSQERGAIRDAADMQIDYLQRSLQAAKRRQYVASVSDGGTR
jgi:anti-sigma factor RsiW